MKAFSINLDSEIIELKQLKNESLSTYYKRIINLLIRADDKNRSRKFTKVIFLSSLKATMLDTMMRFFVRDLRNLNVRKNTLRELVFSDRSLLDLHTIAEKSKRTKLKYVKL